MRLPCRTIVAALLCCTSLAAVQAAEITVSTDSDNFSFIKISGTIQDGDSERFNAIAANLTGKAVIVLSSPGGHWSR